MKHFPLAFCPCRSCAGKRRIERALWLIVAALFSACACPQTPKGRGERFACFAQAVKDYGHPPACDCGACSRGGCQK